MEITEYIEFNQFNSKEMGLYLIKRDAPSPDEKEIIEDVPFMQGVLDFSMIYGERIFQNRKITYEFMLFDRAYGRRKVYEQEIKRRLMMHGRSVLFDTHDFGYHWLGKCEEVSVDDDEEYQTLKVKITFDCYPFMLSQNRWFDDIWDNFNFDRDVANYTRYEVNGTKNVLLINSGSVSLSPEVTASSAMTVELDGKTYNFKSGKQTDLILRLKPGENYLVIKGNGTISFHYQTEVMG